MFFPLKHSHTRSQGYPFGGLGAVRCGEYVRYTGGFRFLVDFGVPFLHLGSVGKEHTKPEEQPGKQQPEDPFGYP